MPYVNGKYLHWWQWTAHDKEDGKEVIIFTDGGPGISTKEQLLFVVRQLFPYLDYSRFTCELTEVIGGAFKRKPVPQKYVADPWQQEMHKLISPPAQPPETPKRSILYGTGSPGERQHHDPDRRERRVSVLYGE